MTVHLEIRTNDNNVRTIHLEATQGITTNADLFRGIRETLAEAGVERGIHILLHDGTVLNEADTAVPDSVYESLTALVVYLTRESDSAKARALARATASVLSRASTRASVRASAQRRVGLEIRTTHGNQFILEAIPGITTGADLYRGVRAKLAGQSVRVRAIFKAGVAVKDSDIPLPEPLDSVTPFMAVLGPTSDADTEVEQAKKRLLAAVAELEAAQSAAQSVARASAKRSRRSTPSL